MTRPLLRSKTGWTIGVFGAGTVLLGWVGLIWPGVIIGVLGLEVRPAAARGLVYAIAIASQSMGVYYLLAASQQWRPFFLATVPMRFLNFLVILFVCAAGLVPRNLLLIAAWEILGALATACTLWLERGSRESSPPTAWN